MTKVNRLSGCQACGSTDIRNVMDFGYIPAVNEMPTIGSPPNVFKEFRLNLVQCATCFLVQLDTLVDKEVVFPRSYPYRSGTTQLLVRDFENLAVSVRRKRLLEPGALVVDIGSNDGSLLQAFVNQGYEVLGVEPTDAAQDAILRKIPTLQEYFNRQVAYKIVEEFGQPGVVTATNVFAHIEELKEQVEAIGTLLGRGGIFISENHYLVDLVHSNQYDTIYHEHLRYYHLKPLIHLFKSQGFHVFDVERIPTHGGSIRVYASIGRPIDTSSRVDELLLEEELAGLNTSNWVNPFVSRIRDSKLRLYAMLETVVAKHGGLLGVGAPSRASTLVAHTGLDHTILKAVVEHPNSPKCGRSMPGTSIPIVSEPEWQGNRSLPLLMLSWHIADELLPKLRKTGYSGAAYAPLPEPHLLDS